MASYEAITFQPELFKQEMFKLYDKALDEAVEYVEKNFKPDGGTKGTEISSGTGKEVEVSANSLKAWVLEYGSGIYADIGRNPYWSEYLGSGLTGRKRPGGYVYKRGSGSYTTLDVDSGELITREGGSPQGGYLPQSFQQSAARVAQPFLQKMLEEAYQRFESKSNSLAKSVDPERFFSKSTINV